MNMVKLLLYMGADYTLTNFSKYGTVTTRETPREVAEANKYYKIVELLDKYDAHVKKKAMEAQTTESTEKEKSQTTEESTEKEKSQTAEESTEKEETTKTE